MELERFDEIIMAAFAAIFALLGITEIIGFVLTWMWHCLLLAGMCAGMVWAWYYADYKSQGKKLSTLWQKKNTRQ